jgi:hypothetical protein
MIKRTWIIMNLFVFCLTISAPAVFAQSYEEREEKGVPQEKKMDSPKEKPCMPPKITYLVTDYGNPGDTIHIKGRRFGLNQGKVTFNGIPAEVLSWRMETIYVKVPEKAKTGLVIVDNGCDKSNGVIFTVGPSPHGDQRGTTW